MDSAFTFWQAKTSEWPILASFALDVVSLPASQASTERELSVCVGGFDEREKEQNKDDVKTSSFYAY